MENVKVYFFYKLILQFTNVTCKIILDKKSKVIFLLGYSVNKKRKYVRITYEMRKQIEEMLRKKYYKTTIARELGISIRSLDYELKKFKEDNEYNAEKAQQMTKYRWKGTKDE